MELGLFANKVGIYSHFWENIPSGENGEGIIYWKWEIVQHTQPTRDSPVSPK